MTSTVSRFSAPAAAAGQAVLGLYIWQFGPTTPIPMHFNLAGDVDRWGGRTEAALVIAGMAAVSLIAGWAFDISARRPEADDARPRWHWSRS